MNYRRDNRSLDKFKQDIKDGSLAEREIMTRWLDIEQKRTGRRPVCKDNGCDNTGEYLSDRSVTLAPDFSVEGIGLVEVKFSYPKLGRVFHLKTDQVIHYLKHNACILFCDGWRTDKPLYVMITPQMLTDLVRNAPVVKFPGMGYKECYRIQVDSLPWQTFLLT